MQTKSPVAGGGGSLINCPGTFMMIPVSELKTDREYQRALKGNRVDRIVAEWSWIAFGVITVALRGAGSGNYFIIDGQHRVAAAERAALLELPCLVFETADHKDEAEGFLKTNTARAPMSILDRYRAMLVIKDPTALKLAVLMESAGWQPSTTTKDKGVRCLAFFLYAIDTDEEKLRRIWPLLTALCDGNAPTKRLVSGLFYIERFITNTSLVERHWYRRLMTIGYVALTHSINETCSYEGSGGSASCAKGILRAVNRGLRRKLTLITTEEEAAAETE